jgi:hypothetical protein
LFSVPMFPLPEESHAVFPVPSSNFQWPTRPDSVPLDGAVGVGVTVDPVASVRSVGAAGGGVKHCEYASVATRMYERNRTKPPSDTPFDLFCRRFPALDK